jgi:5-methylcytosine-specific restriction endonuclease McrA
MAWLAKIRPRSKARPGRLKGDSLKDLREQCYERDNGICGGGRVYPQGKSKGHKIGCGFPVNPNNWQMAHLIAKRIGGDNLENVVTTHPTCHLIGMHNPKSVPRKNA